MNALFICGKARMRSPTAADIASEFDGVSTDFAGLSNDADEHLSTEHLDWADIVFVMETRQKKVLNSRFGQHLRTLKVVTLGIPDNYAYMDPELIALLRPKLESTLRFQRKA